MISSVNNSISPLDILNKQDTKDKNIGSKTEQSNTTQNNTEQIQKDNLEKQELEQYIKQLFYRPISDVVEEVMGKFNRNEENWALNVVNKIEDKLAGKYTEEQKKGWIYPANIKSKEEALDAALYGFVEIFDHTATDDRRLTISSKRADFGTEQEEQELEDFFATTRGGQLYGTTETYMNSADISIEDFKKHYKEVLDRDTKLITEENRKFWEELYAYNDEILAKNKKKFEPITGKSKDNTTYNAYANAKFNYLQEKLKIDERVLDMFEIMEKLSKQINIRA
ncbi:hypothetical protein [Campylobacter fetus]|nr:hypothetical protein [Campylobacter fetus]ALV64340.1 hypothetical protein CFTSP3_0356 [Campylobacter fetus subsp. testudinum Sp3]AVK80699.1 hypothetical protein C6B32_02225 [Campylobacter fetus subsp. testudinum]EAK0830250.1 hypothetical protein [Campylobacter fetus]MPB72756.1 hypothetical protein [Campylobacter fetus]MPB76839.1 hypothetical protein [Campylobacter fetus]